jgi:hypothetical protein
MDDALLILYLPAALLSVGWSFWAHSLWEGLSGLKDDSGVRDLESSLWADVVSLPSLCGVRRVSSPLRPDGYG